MIHIADGIRHEHITITITEKGLHQPPRSTLCLMAALVISTELKPFLLESDPASTTHTHTANGNRRRGGALLDYFVSYFTRERQ
jgi:hypothetical protein